jgi:trehalose-phosphatase
MEPVDDLETCIGEISKEDALFLLLDYDGTLVPIAPTPDEAEPDPGLLTLLRSLTSVDPLKVAVISGRPMEELLAFFPVEGLMLAGNHGAEFAGPGGGIQYLAKEREILPALEKLKSAMMPVVGKARGLFLEDKGVAIALHFRLADPGLASEAVEKFAELCRQPWAAGSLQILRGKKVIEARSRGADKGMAIRQIIKKFSSPRRFPIYIGDDRTDEEAFAVIRDGGLGIRVGEKDQESLARFRLAGPERVRSLLEAILLSFASRS